MNRFLFSVMISLFLFDLHAQPFKYDEFGNVEDPKFKAFITKRGYKLVGHFYRISVGKKSLMAAKVLKGTKWIFIDVNGKEIENPGEMLRIEQGIPEIGHPDVFPTHRSGPNDMKFEKFKGFGTADARGLLYDGDTIAQGIYQQIVTHAADHLFVVKKDNKYGILDEKGRLVIPIEYESLSPIGSSATSEFFYYAKKDGKAGILSQDNRVTIPFEFEELMFKKTYFETNMRVKGRPNNRGVIDLKGKEIIPCIYTGIVGDYEGFYIVSRGKSNKNLVVGMTDQYGKFILDTVYSEYHNYVNSDSKHLIQFEQLEKPNSFRTTSGIYDTRLKKFVILPGKYSISRVFYPYGREVNFYTNKGYLHGWAGKSGKLLIEPIYEKLEATGDSPFLVVKKDEKYGVIDSTGKVILPFKYEALEHFDPFSFETDIKRGDAFIVTENGKQGVINTKGKLLIPMEYEFIETCSNGIICKKEGVTKIMNLEARVYFETNEPGIGNYSSGYGFVKTGNLQYDFYGNKITPVK